MAACTSAKPGILVLAWPFHSGVKLYQLRYSTPQKTGSFATRTSIHPTTRHSLAVQINLNLKSLASLALAVALAGWAVWKLNPLSGRTDTAVIATEVPVIIRTEGGLLEVATVRAQERFSRVDAKEIWGIPLGTTVSHIQAPAYYRYQIELAPEWRVVIRGKTCFVQAPAIKPSLPVAFDTSALQKYSQNGWARFNAQENLAALERSISTELESRARSDTYRLLATPPARQTVEEFVRKWLLKEQAWGGGPDYRVVVTFPGEPSNGPAAVSPH